MLISNGAYKSVCCETGYTEKFEKTQIGQILALYVCDGCGKECKIATDAVKAMSGCCLAEVELPKYQENDGRVKVQQPRMCSVCEHSENHCKCKTTRYFNCTECHQRTNVVPVGQDEAKKLDRIKVKVRKDPGDVQAKRKPKKRA